MPGEEHEEDRRKHLLLVEDVSVLLGMDHSADHVLARGPALALEQLVEVVDELPQPRPNLLFHLPAAADALGAEEVFRPPPDSLAVLARDAEHVADYRHWEWVGERLNQVHPPVGRH